MSGSLVKWRREWSALGGEGLVNHVTILFIVLVLLAILWCSQRQTLNLTHCMASLCLNTQSLQIMDTKILPAARENPMLMCCSCQTKRKIVSLKLGMSLVHWLRWQEGGASMHLLGDSIMRFVLEYSSRELNLTTLNHAIITHRRLGGPESWGIYQVRKWRNPQTIASGRPLERM